MNPIGYLETSESEEKIPMATVLRNNMMVARNMKQNHP